ncbi:MAG: sodium:solute symporter [Phaeodactylibacter sp.]|nr:sodium:solute symporter [Phaeodactylibacter sp.]
MLQQHLTPTLILSLIAVYFLMLIVVSYFTGRKAGNAEFFLAGRKSPWYLVAFGMVGASLSGVTFISIPGVVGANGLNQDFSYMQIVFGYVLGYLVIARVLLPLYYRLNLTTIYGYLEQRLGLHAYKTGAAYFLLSRAVGSAFRLYLVAIVLQEFVLGPFGIPFWATVGVTIILIWVYTFKGGINTIVYTDTLQTFCMLAAVVLSIVAIGNAMETDIGGLVKMVRSSSYSKVFFFEGGWNDPNNFFKQFISGALITIVMTGMDQDMMQKNLSCRNIGEAQKNMYTFSTILVFANVLFLTLGALLYIYASSIGLDIPEQTDKLYPTLALRHLSPAVGVLFVLGIIAAAYSSADSALTALTTSFCVDFLGFEKSEVNEEGKQRTRFFVHIGFSILLFLIIVVFNAIHNEAVISSLFVAAGYTYGPILGLFAFGLLTRYNVRSALVVPVCLVAPVLSFFLDKYSGQLFFGFQFGFLIIALNGLLTFLGLLAITRWGEQRQSLNG